MTSWSVDILRQSGWDLWVLICMIATLVLLSYVVVARPWRSLTGWVQLLLAAVGTMGTAAVLGIGRLHNPFVGLGWTFVLLTLLSATFYLNLKPQLGFRRMSILLAIRIVTLAMLVPMLFEPVLRWISKPKPEIPLLFLVDTSGSMSFPDVQNGPTRIQSVWQTLRPQIPRLRDHFVTRFFTFATDVEEIKKPEDLAHRAADGKATDIAGGLKKLIVKSFGLRADESIIVLISDGIDNTSPNVAEQARAIGRTIHTVRVGSEQAEPAAVANVAVGNVEASDDFVVDQEAKVRITIKSTALANRVVDVKLAAVDGEGKPAGKVATKALVLQPLPEGQVVEIPYTPAKVGIQRLAAWVDAIPGERSTVDNRQEFQGLALDPRIRVLYIEGRARPEFRDLNRVLSRDPNIESASILRLTQDRFTVAGTVNGQPVSQVPSGLADWKKFDVVILGDLGSTFLTPFQQGAIEQYTAGGGALLMIGGQNSFGPGGYKDTPIEKALPVFVGDASSSQELTPFVPRLTPEGQAHPAMEGLTEWFGANPDAKHKLPPLRGNVVVAKPKSGASVLLTHPDRIGPDGQPQIVLAAQRYGQGRSAAFTADTTYLWYTPLRGMGQDSPYNRFWGQLVRWLAGADVRNRSRGAGVDGLLNKNMYQLGESVRVRAMVRDDRGDATRYAQVNVKLRRPDGKEATQYPLNPAESRTGLYDVTIPQPEKGDWVLELVAMKDGKALGKQELKFTVIPPAEELLKIAANPGLLREISSQTRGFHYELAQLPGLVDELIRSQGAKTAPKQRTVALACTPKALLAAVGADPDWATKYDLPMQAGLVVMLLAGEWMLRRRWQLP